MTIEIYEELEQGSPEWLSARCGLLTASEMKLIITPTLEIAKNDKEKKHLYEILAQRITNYVEPSYINDDMLRGGVDEIRAKALYEEKYVPIRNVGFITNDKWGFKLGFSPDGLVGDDGGVECKSRKQKLQIETILAQEVPKEHLLQVQTGLLVSERAWIDYISYCGGLPMCVLRVFQCPVIAAAILAAAQGFEDRLKAAWARYDELLANPVYKLTPTERIIEIEEEIV